MTNYRTSKPRLSFEYCSYHIFDHSEQELLNMSNPFALIVLACQKALGEGKVPDAELGADRLTIAKALLKHNYERDRIIRFLTFLKNFLYLNDLNINRIFEQAVVFCFRHQISITSKSTSNTLSSVQERHSLDSALLLRNLQNKLKNEKICIFYLQCNKIGRTE